MKQIHLELFLVTATALASSMIPTPGHSGDDKKLSVKIAALIDVFADPEAAGDNIEATQQAIKELTAIGKPAVPQLLEAILSKGGTVATYSASNCLAPRCARVV